MMTQLSLEMGYALDETQRKEMTQMKPKWEDAINEINDRGMS